MVRKFKPIMAQLPDPESIDIPELAREYQTGDIELFCVLGPTASGKTKYAVRLAHQLRELTGQSVEILSADSRQIYVGMDICTGKDLADYGDVPYHLIDILPAGSKYNVYQFQQDFRAAFDDIRRRGAIPVLCGGTGLYINAVTLPNYTFDDVPGQGLPQENHAALGTVRGRGPAARLGGVERSETFSGASPCPGTFPKTYYIGTLVSREVRNKRIDARLDARLQEGLVQEIRGLLDSGVPAEALIAYGLEYKFVTQYVIGQLQYEEMRTLLATAIHQFAKRQMTWFRGMERAGVTIHWVQV